MVRKIADPVLIPVPGNKTIQEYIGHIRTESADYSVAHMIAPPKWSEPFQLPKFDEITIVIKGVMRVESESGTEDVAAGEVILVTAGERIRYSNPHSEDAEYWAICVPAFSPDLAQREG